MWYATTYVSQNIQRYMYVQSRKVARRYTQNSTAVISEEGNWNTREEGKLIYCFVSFEFGIIYCIFKNNKSFTN